MIFTQTPFCLLRVQSALSDGSHSHSLHLVVRAVTAAVGGTTAAVTAPVTVNTAASSSSGGSSGGGSAGPSRTQQAAAPAPASAAPGPVDASAAAAAGSYSRDGPSSAGGSSTSGQHTDDATSDGGAAGPGIPMQLNFGATAGMSPMFVFGTHANSGGLLYTGMWVLPGCCYKQDACCSLLGNCGSAFSPHHSACGAGMPAD
jgi:hypothetical protein